MSTAAKFTLDQYEHMISKGAFDGLNRQRVELIYGELREMSPIGTWHVNIVSLLNRWSMSCVGEDRAVIYVQSPIALPNLDSMPEPDLAWIKPGDYWDRRAESEDIFLVIEVADSSLDVDRGEKAELYAQAGIEDYWIVNIPDRCIEVHRSPHHGRYRSLQTYEVGEQVRPLKFPDAVLEVASLFPAE